MSRLKECLALPDYESRKTWYASLSDKEKEEIKAEIDEFSEELLTALKAMTTAMKEFAEALSKLGEEISRAFQ